MKIIKYGFLIKIIIHTFYYIYFYFNKEGISFDKELQNYFNFDAII